ncbi:MAG: hypothetical protein ABSF72_12815 [Candidatus Sulfotelmatobacter sp.]|jgi:hypothetical protein
MLRTLVRIFQCLLRAALALSILATQASAGTATKSHVITFGKWTTVQCFPESGAADEKPLTLKVRPLLVDTRVKEFTLGPAHDVTDRLFVVRRAFRVNDSLPQESAATPHWEWQPGAWLLVDRATGRISPLSLPDFDVFYSVASWYRDYAAYCGVSDDSKKVYAVVAQINRRKPILKKPIEGENVVDKDMKNAPGDSACSAPAWQRTPARVTFEPAGAPKQTFAIRGHAVDLLNESEEEDEEAAK